MKKTKKLELKKITLTNLNDKEQSQVLGGYITAYNYTIAPKVCPNLSCRTGCTTEWQC